MTTHFTHNSITHKGVTVNYTVDFQKKEVSIVNQDRKVKNFIFQNRGLEYMNPWIDILDAIRIAIEEAEGLLKERKKEDTDKRIQEVMDIAGIPIYETKLEK